jgi:YD repeat-containing protein
MPSITPQEIQLNNDNDDATVQWINNTISSTPRATQWQVTYDSSSDSVEVNRPTISRKEDPESPKVKFIRRVTEKYGEEAAMKMLAFIEPMGGAEFTAFAEKHYETMLPKDVVERILADGTIELNRFEEIAANMSRLLASNYVMSPVATYVQDFTYRVSTPE